MRTEVTDTTDRLKERIETLLAELALEQGALETTEYIERIADRMREELEV